MASSTENETVINHCADRADNRAGDTTSKGTDARPVIFTKDWTRPGKPGEDGPSGESPFRHLYPCLVCGAYPAGKKCGRCSSAVYCSADCQGVDYTTGRHKTNCKLIASLTKEKTELEEQLWSMADGRRGGQGTGNDDGVGLPPVVGEFWKEVRDPSGASPLHQSQPSTSATTKYCVCLLQLVQILGRGESWRVKKTSYHPTMRRRKRNGEERHDAKKENDDVTSTIRSEEEEAGNACALTRALDIGLDLLYLDRLDMRVRLCIPSLYIELGRLQEAYDFCKYWLLPSSTAMLETVAQNEYDGMEDILKVPYLNLRGENMFESPESWADFHGLYTSVGMVFEMSLIKLKTADRVRRGSDYPISSGLDRLTISTEVSPSETNMKASDANPLLDVNAWVAELEKHAKLLLSCVHGFNPHLLPPMGKYSVSSTPPGGPPAAVQELLNYTPGLDLQYSLGNAGGGSKEEAIGVWQKDMVIWDNDRNSMSFLADFASDLKSNLVPVPTDESRAAAEAKAKKLADKLREMNPSISADQIMMHPEMAELMIKQLEESRQNKLS